MAFGCIRLLVRAKGDGKALLGFSIVDLIFVAGYEIYIDFFWGKTVHAAIRMDIFLVDLPMLALGVATGVAGIYRASRRSNNTEGQH